MVGIKVYCTLLFSRDSDRNNTMEIKKIKRAVKKIDHKTQRIVVRLTLVEMKALKELARIKKMSISDLARYYFSK